MHFCPQLEGSAHHLAALMAQIEQDPRQTHVTVLHHGPLAQRGFGSFSLGYTSVEDTEVLERLQKLRGQAAVEAFVALLPELDVGG